MHIQSRNLDNHRITASTLIPLVRELFEPLQLPDHPEWAIFVHGLFAEQTDMAQITCSADASGSPVPGTPPFDAHEYVFPLDTTDPPTLDRIKDKLFAFSHLLAHLSSGG